MYKVAAVVEKGEIKISERPIPKPGRGQVLLKVLACGVCKSDELVVEQHMPVPLPRVPGHEVIGIVEALGEGVEQWKKGDRLGAGWYGGKCDLCNPCKKGNFVHCAKNIVTGISHDGGYAEYIVQPQEALCRIPEELTSEEAAPLLCAGITVFNALRNSGAIASDFVGIQGIGGLGHLAVQFAVKMGFRVVVLGRGNEKKKSALDLGAHMYVNTEDKKDPGFAKITDLGGINVILSTSPASAMKGLIDLLAVNGTLIVVGVDAQDIPGISPLSLLMKSASVKGWASGTAADWKDTLDFAVLTGVKAHVTPYPLEKAAEAYAAMISGKVGRIVLVPGSKH